VVVRVPGRVAARAVVFRRVANGYVDPYTNRLRNIDRHHLDRGTSADIVDFVEHV